MARSRNQHRTKKALDRRRREHKEKTSATGRKFRERVNLKKLLPRIGFAWAVIKKTKENGLADHVLALDTVHTQNITNALKMNFFKFGEKDAKPMSKPYFQEATAQLFNNACELLEQVNLEQFGDGDDATAFWKFLKNEERRYDQWFASALVTAESLYKFASLAIDARQYVIERPDLHQPRINQETSFHRAVDKFVNIIEDRYLDNVKIQNAYLARIPSSLHTYGGKVLDPVTDAANQLAGLFLAPKSNDEMEDEAQDDEMESEGEGQDDQMDSEDDDDHMDGEADPSTT
ncbi:hypothetical protein QBC46DRAFT_452121 [Diplogelasinospora grovesii]|uniref:Uncharacterized protein n=1 Tax=Diplogelasinospora grovesii TaxID=303347 RepID=A0AAN6S1P3_9PEZI|nr:hypothetical protein QBC46DRAFT_452121 [Diplogelasinospora grovesii]